MQTEYKVTLVDVLDMMQEFMKEDKKIRDLDPLPTYLYEVENILVDNFSNLHGLPIKNIIFKIIDKDKFEINSYYLIENFEKLIN